MTARIEVVPVDVDPDTVYPSTPSLRPHFLRLVAGNGETLGHSENYVNRSSALRAAHDWQRAMLEVTEQGDRGIRMVREAGR